MLYQVPFLGPCEQFQYMKSNHAQQEAELEPDCQQLAAQLQGGGGDAYAALHS